MRGEDRFSNGFDTGFGDSLAFLGVGSSDTSGCAQAKAGVIAGRVAMVDNSFHYGDVCDVHVFRWL